MACRGAYPCDMPMGAMNWLLPSPVVTATYNKLSQSAMWTWLDWDERNWKTSTGCLSPSPHSGKNPSTAHLHPQRFRSMLLRESQLISFNFGSSSHEESLRRPCHSLTAHGALTKLWEFLAFVAHGVATRDQSHQVTIFMANRAVAFHALWCRACLVWRGSLHLPCCADVYLHPRTELFRRSFAEAKRCKFAVQVVQGLLPGQRWQTFAKVDRALTLCCCVLTLRHKQLERLIDPHVTAVDMGGVSFLSKLLHERHPTKSTKKCVEQWGSTRDVTAAAVQRGVEMMREAKINCQPRFVRRSRANPPKKNNTTFESRLPYKMIGLTGIYIYIYISILLI